MGQWFIPFLSLSGPSEFLIKAFRSFVWIVYLRDCMQEG